MQTRAIMEAAIEVKEEDGYDIIPEIMIPLVGEKKELKYCKDVVCPDGCVIFRLTAKKTGNENFYRGKFLDEGGQTRLSGPVPGHGNAQSGMKFPR